MCIPQRLSLHCSQRSGSRLAIERPSETLIRLQVCKLIWVFAKCICHFVGLLCSGSLELAYVKCTYRWLRWACASTQFQTKSKRSGPAYEFEESPHKAKGPFSHVMAHSVSFQTASNIAEYNVLSMFHEIATQTKYVPPEPKKKTEKEKEGPKLQGSLLLEYFLN